MKLPSLKGVLLFLAIANIVAVDTYLYLTLVRRAEASGAATVPAAGAGSPPGAMDPVSNLNQGQRTELARIKREFRDATGGIYARVKELEDEMYRLLQDDPVAQDKIDRNLEEYAKRRLELKRMAIRTMIEAREVLTPEQREELFKAIFRTPTRSGAVGAAVDSARGAGQRGK